MRYEKPEMKVIDITKNDVITASGITGGNNSANVGGGGNLED